MVTQQLALATAKDSAKQGYLSQYNNESNTALDKAST